MRKLRSYTFIHRYEWPALSGGSQASLLTYEHSSNTGFKNWGIYALNERFANNAIMFNDLGITWNYPIQITRNIMMSFGATAILKHKYVDLDKLTFGDLIDPRNNLSYSGQSLKTHSFGMSNNYGILMYTQNLFLGFSAKHLTRINYQNSPSYNVQAGYTIYLPTKKYKYLGLFRAGLSYSYQNETHRMDVLASMHINRFVIGGSIGSPRAFSAMFGIQFYRGLNISYIYDKGANVYSMTTGGSHEIMLRYDLNIRCCKCRNWLFNHSDF